MNWPGGATMKAWSVPRSSASWWRASRVSTRRTRVLVSTVTWPIAPTSTRARDHRSVVNVAPTEMRPSPATIVQPTRG